MTDGPIDLMEERWNRIDDCDRFRPEEALIAAQRQLNRGDYEAKHIVIVVLDGEAKVRWLQAGAANKCEIVGMLERAKSKALT